MRATTCSEKLFEKLLSAMCKFTILFEKLIRLATVNATAMVGTQKGITALVKKE